MTSKLFAGITIAAIGLFSWTHAQTITVTETNFQELKTTDCGNNKQSIGFTVKSDETIKLDGIVVAITGDNETIKHIELIEKGANTLLPNIYHGWTPVRNDTATLNTLSESNSSKNEQLFILPLKAKFLKASSPKVFELIPIVGCDTTAIFSIDIVGVSDDGIIRMEQENTTPSSTFEQEMTVTPVKGNDISIESIVFNDELRIATIKTCFETKQPIATFEKGISTVIKIVNSSQGTRREIPVQRDITLSEACVETQIQYSEIGIDEQHKENRFQLYANDLWSYNYREETMSNNYIAVDYTASVDYSTKKPTLQRKEVSTFPDAKIAFELCNVSFDTKLTNPGGEVLATIKNKTNNVEFQTTARYNDILRKDQCIYFWAHRKDLGIRNEGIYLINVIIEDLQFLSQFSTIDIFRPKITVEQGEEFMIQSHSELAFDKVLISKDEVTATVCNSGGMAISNKQVSLRFNKVILPGSKEQLLDNYEHTKVVSLNSRTCTDIVVPVSDLPSEFFTNNSKKELKIWIFSSYNDIQEYDYNNNSKIITLEFEKAKDKPHSEWDFCRYSNCEAYLKRITTMKETLLEQEKKQIIRTTQHLIGQQASQDKKDILLFLLYYLQ